MGLLDRIKDIEDEMNRTQKNKATEHHIGLLKARLAKLRAQLLEPTSKGGKSEGFEVQKSGDARICIIGFPSVGKSTMLTKLTETKSEISSVEFTTLTCIPGVLRYKGANIQLLDTPGIIDGASQECKGRQVVATAKTADLIVLMLDPTREEAQKKVLERELEAVGIRINKQPPDISLKRKKTGGIIFNNTVPLTHLDEKLVRGILHEYKMHNVDIVCRCDATVDEFIDIIEGAERRAYVPCLYLYNKIDHLTIEEVEKFAEKEHTIVMSCELDLNMDYLLEMMWQYLSLCRVYTKKRGFAPSFNEPLIMRSGSTIEDVCLSIHKDMKQHFKYALVWGTSTKHSPQRVGINHVLGDEDVVEIHTG